MAKFFGAVGYGSQVREAGISRDVITEFNYQGDLVDNERRLQEGESLNKDISINNSISILADPYASAHFFAIRYVEWAGVRWSVTSVKIAGPRLLLDLGGVYNGPTPEAEETSGNPGGNSG